MPITMPTGNRVQDASAFASIDTTLQNVTGNGGAAATPSKVDPKASAANRRHAQRFRLPETSHDRDVLKPLKPRPGSGLPVDNQGEPKGSAMPTLQMAVNHVLGRRQVLIARQERLGNRLRAGDRDPQLIREFGDNEQQIRHINQTLRNFNSLNTSTGQPGIAGSMEPGIAGAAATFTELIAKTKRLTRIKTSLERRLEKTRNPQRTTRRLARTERRLQEIADQILHQYPILSVRKPTERTTELLEQASKKLAASLNRSTRFEQRAQQTSDAIRQLLTEFAPTRKPTRRTGEDRNSPPFKKNKLPKW
jgi:hypothetical protein